MSRHFAVRIHVWLTGIIAAWYPKALLDQTLPEESYIPSRAALIGMLGIADLQLVLQCHDKVSVVCDLVRLTLRAVVSTVNIFLTI